jgi:hypothetical protein
MSGSSIGAGYNVEFLVGRISPVLHNQLKIKEDHKLRLTCHGLSASRKGFTSAFAIATSSGVTKFVQIQPSSLFMAWMNSSMGASTGMRCRVGLEIGTILISQRRFCGD